MTETVANLETTLGGGTCTQSCSRGLRLSESPLRRVRWHGVRQAHHRERGDQSGHGGDERNQQSELQGLGARVVVDADDLLSRLLGLSGEQLVELRIAHHLGVVLQDVGNALLLGGMRTLLASALLVKVMESAASRIAPANAKPTERPKELTAELTPEASPATLLIDRRERVAVGLRDQEAQTGSSKQQRNHQVPAAVHPRHERDQQQHPGAEQGEPRSDEAAGRRLPARFPASSATPKTVSDRGASDRPACSAL